MRATQSKSDFTEERSARRRRAGAMYMRQFRIVQAAPLDPVKIVARTATWDLTSFAQGGGQGRTPWENAELRSVGAW
jgi:hypothetical protein